MDDARRVYFLRRYQNVIEAILVALEHVPQDQLDRRPEPKARSARETVHFVADQELQESIRLRRMLAENTPVLMHWDDQRYSERLHYNRSVDASLEMIRALAHANIELLGCLTDEQWQREGNVQRPWTLTVESWLEENVTALHNCLMQILNAPSGGRVIADPE